MAEQNRRVPIIDASRCQPTKCNFECGLVCPVNRREKQCVELVDIEDLGKVRRVAKVNESMCIGCGMCASDRKRGCPFGAVKMAQIPTQIERDTVHRYGENGFRLYRMPLLRAGVVNGLIGPNGVGKSTVVGILQGKIRPNFGSAVPLTDDEIVRHFRGTELQTVMAGVLDGSLRVVVKPQNLGSDLNPRAQVNEVLTSPSSPWEHKVWGELALSDLSSRALGVLSGGELQRVVCARALLAPSDLVIFDEPMNYLDVHWRLVVARLIRGLSGQTVVVIDHDLAMLEFMTDTVSILFGEAAAFGVVSRPMSTANAINAYLDGFIPGDNMRFRPQSVSFAGLNVAEPDELSACASLDVDATRIQRGAEFSLEVSAGRVPCEAALVVLLGENGTGKSTLVGHLAGQLGQVSVKPQTNALSPPGELVIDFLLNGVPLYGDATFRSEVARPLGMDALLQRSIGELSGGELQRVGIVRALGQDAPIVLLDEPSSHLDIEQRIVLAKVLKRYAINRRKLVFVVEHDMMVAVALGAEARTQVISLARTGPTSGASSAPAPFGTGLNVFLAKLGITFRVDTPGAPWARPRINAPDSLKDREQKAAGTYFV